MFPRLYSDSKVTMELRDVLTTTDENGKPFDLWAFDYPSYYKGEDKKAFEQKVIDHYFFRQIGSETIARFHHQFKTRVREIMPRYLDLYKTVEIMANIDDPFGNIDITETFEERQEGSASNSGSSSSSGNSNTATATSMGSEHRDLDTPHLSISNMDDYLSHATQENSNGDEDVTTNVESSEESTNETTTEATVTHTLTRKGNQGVNTYAHDMIEFRQSIIDVDMMIINDLNDLFLMVY